MTTSQSYRAALTPLTEIVERVSDWSAPSPCAGWSAADVLDHLVTTQRSLLAERGFDLAERGVPAGDVAADPVTTWRTHGEAVAQLLADPSVDGLAYDGFFGPTTLGETMTRFYVFDMLVHRWDLARAADLPIQLTDAELDHIETSAASFGEVLYMEGICAPAVAVAADADRQTRVLATLGRTA